MYYIKQFEPEGWEKAFVVMFAGKRIATFSFRDSAEYWISEHIA
jgi:hypothetical protein